LHLKRAQIHQKYGIYSIRTESISTSSRQMVFPCSPFTYVGKRYTITVSNEIAAKRPDGRDQSTILYEYSFDPEHGPYRRYVKWDEFKPFYRGKPKEDAPGLDIGCIRRWSFMIRSFFDRQHGEFRVAINCVCAYREKAGEKDRKKTGETKGGKGKWCSIQ
jgi:hypothetical protein